MVSRAVAWLVAKQREDGGWGEDCDSYGDAPPGEFHGEAAQSLPSQTAWAMLGLMAVGQVDHEAVRRGVAFLQARRTRRAVGPRKPITRSASRACSTSNTTAIRGFSRCWPEPLPQPAGLNDRQVKFGF